MPTYVPVSISIAQRCHALRILTQITSIPIINLIISILIIDLGLDAQNLATANIQWLFVNVLVLFILSIR